MKLVVLLGGMTLCCPLSELLVLLLAGEQPKFPRHVVGAPWGLRYNEPGARYRHKSADVNVQFRINGQGMRADRDYAHEKPPGVKRILSLGDSYTVGYEVELEQTFSSVLEARLRAQGLQVEVLNCGVSGYSNAEECLYVEKELLRYQPDLVLVSFYWNDLADNVRSGLFQLEGEQLVQKREGYVPGGGLGDWLNQSWLFSLLSERSNAFCLLKERLTILLKGRMVQAGQRELEQAGAQAAGGGGEGESPEDAYQRRLALAIFERLYAGLAARKVPLVIQSIPLRMPVKQADGSFQEVLLESFPPGFDATRSGTLFFSAKEVLDPLVGKETLYYRRSHWHWTPIAHQRSGERLAELILERGLLR